jgi:hypothetical protein
MDETRPSIIYLKYLGFLVGDLSRWKICWGFYPRKTRNRSNIAENDLAYWFLFFLFRAFRGEK